MCVFGGSGSVPPPATPVRYSQQRLPQGKDTLTSKNRAETQRRRATKTVLSKNETEDTGNKKTLLGA